MFGQKKPKHIFHVNMQECGLLYAIVDPAGMWWGGGYAGQHTLPTNRFK